MSDNDAKSIIDGLSKPFDRAVIKKKPGSKPGADRFKPATDYVSHGLVTKRLNDIAPGWSSRVVEWHSYIDPKGVLICAGVTLEVTIPGAGSHQEFGKSANRIGFGDDAKNALSDALKRCAMRFGVAIDLWESAEEHDEDAQDDDEAQSPAPRQTTQQRPAQGAETVLKDIQERAIARARDMAEAGSTYNEAKAEIAKLEMLATPDEWKAIKRRWLKVREQFYPDTVKQQPEGAQ